MGKRTDNHSYCTPGGKVEFGETVARALVREVKEETNILILEENLHLVGYKEPEGKFILFFYVPFYAGQPKNTEPGKCHGWEWVPLTKHDVVIGLRLLQKDKVLLDRLESLRQKHSFALSQQRWAQSS